MDPTQEEKQNNEPQQKRPAGESAINTINNFARMGFTKPLGKIGSKAVAQTALRGFAAFFAANPWVWGILAVIVIIVFFTFLIVGFGGAPPSETNVQTPITPISEPTTSITPSQTVP